MALILDHVIYEYGSGTELLVRALNDVSLVIPDGQFIGLIGHTGSGKSTLIQHFNGLLKPTGGEVLLAGQSIWDEKGKCARDVRFRVGLVFQYPEYQLFEETIAKDIAFGPRNMGLPEEEIQERVREAMAFVGLEASLAEKSPFALSGGQKRRVAIAGVIAMRPEVLVLDEPTAGLDPAGCREILDEIRQYHAETGATVLIVSHSMEDTARMADRMLVMNQARVMLLDRPEAVFARAEEILAAGLDVPEITKVFLELRRRGVPVSASVYTVEQALAELRRVKGGGAVC